MRIVELKSQSAKIIYKPAVEEVKAGDFITFTEDNLTIIAQVYKILSSNTADEFNQADLCFVLTKKYDKITVWQGELVSAEAVVEKAPLSLIENYINQSKDGNCSFGNALSYDKSLHLDFQNFTTPAFIGYERTMDNKLMLETLGRNFNKLAKNLLIFDYKGNIELPYAKKVIAGVQAKLPLSKDMIMKLSSKILEGVSLESKAVIEDVLLELADYAQETNLGFIPITKLISTIEDFYKKSKIPPLLLLKNKLTHYKKLNIFADTQNETVALNETLLTSRVVIYDLSNIMPDWQNEFLTDFVNKKHVLQDNLYIYYTLDELNFDNSILNYLLFKTENNNICPIISANYRHLAFDSIFDFSNNIFLFKTYGSLNKRMILGDLLQSLPQNCFLLTGDLSDGLYLLHTLLPVSEEENENTEIDNNEEEQTVNQENINNDVVEINTTFQPSISIKNPAKFINTPITPNIATAINLNNDFIPATQNPVISDIQQPIETQSAAENHIEENIIPDIENVVEDNAVSKIEDTISIEEIPVNIPSIDIGMPEKKDEIIKINMPEQPISEPAVVKNIKEDEIIELVEDNSSVQDDILDFVEEEQSQGNDLSDLIEEVSEDSSNEDDVLFEEVSTDDSLENINVDDLDFLSEADEQNDVQSSKNQNDDELLDLLDNEEQADETEQILQPEKEPLPIYDADYSKSTSTQKTHINFNEGDLIKHNKYGIGTIKKITRHGDKCLCHINFDTFGRRLLDPEISQLEKID